MESGNGNSPGRRRKRPLRLWLILAALVTVGILLVRSTVKDCTGTMGIASAGQINRIEVQTDSGKHRSITSREEIEKVTQVLNSARYLRDDLQPPYTGYAYLLAFYDSKGEIGRVIFGAYPIIDDVRYLQLGPVDRNRLKEIVGIEN